MDIDEIDTLDGHDANDAMALEKRHFAMQPSLILDVDNGIDFTFDKLGLRGNRPAPEEKMPSKSSD